MAKSFTDLKSESQKILDAAYTNHFGFIQTCVVGSKWVLKIKDKKVVKVPVDDVNTQSDWDSALTELNDNNYIKPHLDFYRVTEQGYLCVENRNK